MHRFLLKSFLLLTMSSTALAGFAPSCKEIFPGSFSEVDLQTTIDGLARLKLRIDLSLSRGATVEARALQSALEVKEAELLTQTDLLNEPHLHDLIQQRLMQIQEAGVDAPKDESMEVESENRRQSERMIEDANYDGSRILLHRIEPGSLKLRVYDKEGHRAPKLVEVDVTINHSYALAATLTSIRVWEKIGAAARLRFPTEHFPNFVATKEPKHTVTDLFPVNFVSHQTVTAWFDALNRLAAAHDPIVKELFPFHEDGMIYRLPTETEWFFVAEQTPARRIFETDIQEFRKYAWINSEDRVFQRQIGLKLPFKIGAQEFYDLFGNLSEWTDDWYGPRPGLIGPNTKEKLYLGGSFCSLANECYERKSYPRHVSAQTLGFRIAADLPPRAQPSSAEQK